MNRYRAPETEDNAMQKLELKDFLNYRYASELAFAPDGAHAAYAWLKVRVL